MQAVNHGEICNHGKRAAWVLLSKGSTGAKAEPVLPSASFLSELTIPRSLPVLESHPAAPAPAHSLSAEVNSAQALCFLPFSPHLQQWGGEEQAQHPGVC